MPKSLQSGMYGKEMRIKMYKYNITHCNRITMLKSQEHSFAEKDKDGFVLYIPDENGVPISFLEKRMGAEADKLLFDFLSGIDHLYKNIFSGDDHYIKLITLMFMYLEINYGDLKSGGFSFCSHSQGLISFYADRKRAERFLEDNYLKNKKLIAYCYSLFENRSGQSAEMYKDLEKSVRKLASCSKEQIAGGNIIFMNEHTEETTFDSSEFHTALYNNTSFIERLSNDIDFSVKRFATICFYTFLKNAGINYEKRCIIAYMIYRYIEEIQGFRYTDIVAGTVKSQ